MNGRGLFAAALLAGGSFTLAVWSGWAGPAIIAWKGAGVALLALWAAVRARSPDGWLIAAVLACGAAGDVLLEIAGLIVGALAFLVGHILAIALYRRAAKRGWALPIVAAGAVSAGGFALTRDPGVAAYGVALGGMAGSAAVSGFPARVAIGAWLFVASDLLIFARLGPLAGSPLPGMLVWPLYFAGQALIAYGVVTTLMHDDDLHHRV